MRFDVIFIDTICPSGYDSKSAAEKPMGGTEATVIRIAEGLAGCGLKIGVFNHKLENPKFTGKAEYYPMELLPEASSSVVVGIRSIKHLDKFKRAKRFVWLHDLPAEWLLKLRDELISQSITCIAVSSWHKTVIQELICDANEKANPKVIYIYNPIIDSLFIEKGVEVPYNRNKLVWLSSPHKGLDKALFLFERFIDLVGPGPELHIYNPGYIEVNKDSSHFRNPGIFYHGPVNCTKAWENIANALCLFYPTLWQETFGLVAAESNCLHTPVASFALGALPEICGFKNQLAPINDNKAYLDKVVSWYCGERPQVYGNAKFKLSEVLVKWIQTLLQ